LAGRATDAPKWAGMVLASAIVAGRIVPPIAQCAKQFPVAMLQTLAPQPPQLRDSGIFFMPVTDWDRTIGAPTFDSSPLALSAAGHNTTAATINSAPNR